MMNLKQNILLTTYIIWLYFSENKSKYFNEFDVLWSLVAYSDFTRKFFQSPVHRNLFYKGKIKLIFYIF